MDGGKGLPYFGLLLFAPRVLLVYASIYTGHTYITFIYIAFLSILRLQYVCCIMSECVCVCIVAAEVTESIHFLFSLFFLSFSCVCCMYVVCLGRRRRRRCLRRCLRRCRRRRRLVVVVGGEPSGE